MILTVTANPAWDVTYTLPALHVGQAHRVTDVVIRPGGKGINVAAVLHALHEPACATGLAAEDFAAAVAARGITSDFVTSLPSVRRTIAVVAQGDTTGFWEAGAAVPATALDDLVVRVHDLLPEINCLVVSGSLPPGASDDLVARLARGALAAGKPVITDTSGAALMAAAQVPGVVLMPNSEELRELVGPVESLDDVASHSRRLVAEGVGTVIATLGADGMVLTSTDGQWHARSPETVTGNATGAGDAAAAAIARGLAAGRPPAEVVADAVALSAAAVAAPVAGDFDRATYDCLKPRILVTHLEGTR
jgi:tagatose 6-phosphate kinase